MAFRGITKKHVPLTTVDVAKIHNWPVGPEAIAKVGCICDISQQLASGKHTHRNVTQMIGNGWNLRTVGKFLMFALSSIEFRSKVYKLTHVPSPTWRESPTKKRKPDADDVEHSLEADSPASTSSLLPINISSQSDKEGCIVIASGWIWILNQWGVVLKSKHAKTIAQPVCCTYIVDLFV